MNPAPIPLSVIVHTRNEEAQLMECLDSCTGWASEVIVADMESSDETVRIAEAAGAKVLHLPFRADFDAARNDSAETASCEWILYLDADERLTEEVKETIETLITDAPDSVGAFQLPFRVYSFGSWIQRAGGWWPSYKSPPLLRKGRFHFPGPVHEPAQIQGEIVRVVPKSPHDAILHLSHRSIEHYFDKLNRYTTQEVNRRQGSAPESWRELARRFGRATGWYFDDTNGRADGLAGFFLSFSSGIYEFATGIKQVEATSAFELPPSAEAFFLEVARASRVEGDANRQALPDWWPRLEELLTFDHPDSPGDGSKRRFELGLVTTTPEVPVDAKENQDIDGWLHLLSVQGDDQKYSFRWFGSRPCTKRVLFVTHRNALNVLGGGEVQLFQTARHLEDHGIGADVAVGLPDRLDYELIHVFSVHHDELWNRLSKAQVPVVVSPIYWNRTELAYLSSRLPQAFLHAEGADEVDAAYMALRAECGRQFADERLLAKELVDGVPPGAIDVLTPNCQKEAAAFWNSVDRQPGHTSVVPNGFDPLLSLSPDPKPFQDRFGLSDFVLCVGRIELNKNQLSLIWALRETDIPLVLIGSEPTPDYARLCRSIAGPSVHFLQNLPPALVASAMSAASLHCLPSFGETPGLVNLEAAAVGCPLVASNRGGEIEYFGDLAQYCDPLDPVSIRSAVERALGTKGTRRVKNLRELVMQKYSWSSVASALSGLYEEMLSR